jgi:hypothetical protein
VWENDGVNVLMILFILGFEYGPNVKGGWETVWQISYVILKYGTNIELTYFRLSTILGIIQLTQFKNITHKKKREKIDEKV